jgi:hypothetical protein
VTSSVKERKRAGKYSLPKVCQIGSLFNGYIKDFFEFFSEHLYKSGEAFAPGSLFPTQPEARSGSLIGEAEEWAA